MLVLCLAGLIAHIMSKALKRDIVQYEVSHKSLILCIANAIKTIGEAQVKEEEDPQ